MSRFQTGLIPASTRSIAGGARFHQTWPDSLFLSGLGTRDCGVLLATGLGSGDGPVGAPLGEIGSGLDVAGDWSALLAGFGNRENLIARKSASTGPRRCPGITRHRCAPQQQDAESVPLAPTRSSILRSSLSWRPLGTSEQVRGSAGQGRPARQSSTQVIDWSKPSPDMCWTQAWADKSRMDLFRPSFASTNRPLQARDAWGCSPAPASPAPLAPAQAPSRGIHPQG